MKLTTVAELRRGILRVERVVKLPKASPPMDIRSLASRPLSAALFCALKFPVITWTPSMLTMPTRLVAMDTDPLRVEQGILWEVAVIVVIPTLHCAITLYPSAFVLVLGTKEPEWSCLRSQKTGGG